MPSKLRYVQAGEPWVPDAGQWNAIVDGLRRKDRRDPRRPDVSFVVDGVNVVWVKNSSGAARSQFDVLALKQPLFLPSAAGWLDEVVWDTLEPAWPTHHGKAAILIEPIPSNGVGRAVIGGQSHATIKMVESWHEWCDVGSSPDQYKLISRPEGSIRILWVESGTGSGKKAYVSYGLPAARTIDCVAPATGLAFGETKSCTVWRAGAATTYTVPVEFKHVGAGITLASGTKFTAIWHIDSKAWRVLIADCP